MIKKGVFTLNLLKISSASFFLCSITTAMEKEWPAPLNSSLTAPTEEKSEPPSKRRKIESAHSSDNKEEELPHKEIVLNLNTINHQDSLGDFKNFPKDMLNAIIDMVINDEETTSSDIKNLKLTSKSFYNLVENLLGNLPFYDQLKNPKSQNQTDPETLNFFINIPKWYLESAYKKTIPEEKTISTLCNAAAKGDLFFLFRTLKNVQGNPQLLQTYKERILSHALSEGQTSVIRFLLKNNLIALEDKNQKGENLLHRLFNAPPIKKTLSFCHDLPKLGDLTDNSQLTRKKDLAAFLLEKGCNPRETNNEGKTAFQKVIESKNQEMIAVFKPYMTEDEKELLKTSF